MSADRTSAAEENPAGGDQGVDLPTTPSSVVWSCGHSYVREGVGGRARWVGVDDRGRARFFTDADLRRRGWSRGRG